MEFQKAIQTYNRCCRTYDSCENCPIAAAARSRGNTVCSSFIKGYPDVLEPILEKWAQEHPERTILTEFLEHYPNAVLYKNGTPSSICPSDLGYTDIVECGDTASDSCIHCWSRTPEEASKEK